MNKHGDWTIDPLDPELNNEKEGVAIIDDCGVIQARSCDIETAEQILNAVNVYAHNKQTIKELALRSKELLKAIVDHPADVALKALALESAISRAWVRV